MAASEGFLKAAQNLKASELDKQYEFEDPIEAWIDLCEACRIENMDLRKAAVSNYLNLAKNSHWTHKLMEAEMVQQAQDAEDVDYAGNDTEPYSDPEDDGGMVGGHGGTYGSEPM